MFPRKSLEWNHVLASWPRSASRGASSMKNVSRPPCVCGIPRVPNIAIRNLRRPGSLVLLVISSLMDFPRPLSPNFFERHARPACRHIFRYLDVLEYTALARLMRLHPFRHRPYTLRQRRLGLLSEDSLGFAVIGECNSYFIARIHMHNSALGLHGLGNDPRQVIDHIRHIRSVVKNLIPRAGNIHGARDNRSHIVDVRERSHLRSIPENRHRLATQNLIHEDSHYIAVAITNVLPLPIHVVRPENNVVQPEHLSRHLEFLLDSQLRDPIGILWDWRHFLPHGCLSRPVNRDR